LTHQPIAKFTFSSSITASVDAVIWDAFTLLVGRVGQLKRAMRLLQAVRARHLRADHGLWVGCRSAACAHEKTDRQQSLGFEHDDLFPVCSSTVSRLATSLARVSIAVNRSMSMGIKDILFWADYAAKIDHRGRLGTRFYASFKDRLILA
jgi:hypothetical protein